MTLNMLTIASMIQLGKVYGNLMVDLQPKSRKLRARALRLIEELGRVTSDQARQYLRRANGRAKVAIVMARTGLSYREAARKLAESKGALGVLLDEASKS
jgi:N-acetylmuramic acid 6-phosphate etherase